MTSSCNCTELARVAAAVDQNELKGLAKQAENPAVIVVTYMMVILPWTILYNFDFISEKWRSIYRTRELGRVHLVIAFLPMPFLLFYTHLQQISNDYKEMMTAVIGLLLCLYHVMRTAWGLLQLRVFSNWCHALIQRMKTLDMIRPRDWKDIGDSNVVDWDSLFKNQDKTICVNNTVVDNELSGTDLDVSIEKSKMNRKTHPTTWLNPTTWLRTDEEVLCTIRWSGAFLCSFGELWGGLNAKGFTSKDELHDVFSKFRDSLNSLHRVTFMQDENRYRCNLNMVNWEKGGPYETSLVNANLRKMIKGLEPRKIALENVMGAYTGVSAVNMYRHPENGLVCAMQYAQCIDEESFNALVCYSDKFNSTVLGWELLVWQNRDFPKDESPVPRALTVPAFPWRKLMVPLWDSCTNWRVLQASVHMDNFVVPPGRDMRAAGRPPKCFYQYTLEKQKSHTNSKKFSPSNYGYAGCILEMVRSFLADWMVSSTSRSEKPNWTPQLTKKTSEFSTTRNIELSDDADVKREQLNQWRWEFQSILHERVAAMDRSDTNLPASLDFILLFILGFPGTFVEQNRGSAPSATQSRVEPVEQNRGSARGPSQSNEDHEIVPIPDEGEVDLVFLFQPRIAPQTIKVQVSVCGNEKKKVVMELICTKSVAKFIWEDWINCAMGYIQERDEYMEEHPKWFPKNFRKRTPAKANLSKGMVTFSHPHSELPELRGDIQVWTGWPFFDIKLVQFEFNQWMQNAGYLSGFCDIVPRTTEREDRNFSTELIRAEEGLLKIKELLARDNPGN